MKFCLKIVINVSDRSENTFFVKYTPKLTWELLSSVFFDLELPFFIGGNNFHFFTHKYFGFIGKFNALAEVLRVL